jgi:hypothetical protein
MTGAWSLKKMLQYITAAVRNDKTDGTENQNSKTFLTVFEERKENGNDKKRFRIRCYHRHENIENQILHAPVDEEKQRSVHTLL